MLVIPKQKTFQPSRDTLDKWLATRKKPIRITDNNSLPGFFSDSNPKGDKNLVIFAFFIEIVGVVLTIYGTVDRTSSAKIVAIVVVLILVLFDILIAMWLHKNKAKKCYIKSQKYVTSPTNENEGILNQLTIEEGEGKIVQYICAILLFAIASIKMYTFYRFFRQIPQQNIRIVVSSLFLVVAFVHYYATGYWKAFYGFFGFGGVKTAIKNDHSKFGKETEFTAFIDKSNLFETEIELKSLPIIVQLENDIIHKIVAQSTNNNKFQYNLITNGVLTDRDIESLIIAQDDNAKEIIAVVARRIQLSMSSDLSGLTKNQNNTISK